MSSIEELATAVLSGTADACPRWPEGDRWVAMAAWRQESVGAVLMGRRRRLTEDEVLYDIVACRRHGDEWYDLGSGGSSVDPVPYPGPEKVFWFGRQEFYFETEDGQDVCVSNFIGAAAPGIERLSLRFSNGSRVETNVLSESRLVFVGVVKQADEELSVHVS